MAKSIQGTLEEKNRLEQLEKEFMIVVKARLEAEEVVKDLKGQEKDLGKQILEIIKGERDKPLLQEMIG